MRYSRPEAVYVAPIFGWRGRLMLSLYVALASAGAADQREHQRQRKRLGQTRNSFAVPH